MIEFRVYYPIYYDGIKCTWHRIGNVFADDAKDAVYQTTLLWGPPRAGYYKAIPIDPFNE
jgi:hypothetical protein